MAIIASPVAAIRNVIFVSIPTRATKFGKTVRVGTHIYAYSWPSTHVATSDPTLTKSGAYPMTGKGRQWVWEMLNALVALRVITVEEKRQHLAACAPIWGERERTRRVEGFVESARAFGVKLSPDQRRAVRRARRAIKTRETA
jgi:hypothetical protein